MRIAVALVLVLSACQPSVRAPAPADERVDIRIGAVTARVHVARTAAQRRKGLQGVARLPANGGMLFLYRRPRRLSIWMKGCLIGLDVAFIGERGRIFQIETLRAPRGGEAPDAAASTRAGVMVLEMPAGFFERHGLGTGTPVKLPAGISRKHADP